MNLLETIKCKNGILHNLEFHQARFNNARTELGFNKKISLHKELIVPESFKNGLFRCRVIYSRNIEKIEFTPHHFRNIKSLKLVYNDEIDYHLKYSNRDYLNKLFNMRGNCDDILIVKNSCISDSWTANPVFYDGKQWWTPTIPLLPGTQRERLIMEKKIDVCEITPGDLAKYQKVGLINAMQDLQNMPIIEIENIS